MIMKHFFLLLTACILGTGWSRAQEQALYECLYQYDINSQNKAGEPFEETAYTVLQIGPTQAKFQDYTSFSLDSLNAQDNVSEDIRKEYEIRQLRNKYYFDQTVYQNFPAGRMSVFSLITPDYYTYEESNHPVSWTLSEETDTVCGYVCKKATGTYGGRTWTAWYAPEIPVPFGPWKLTGLPGLVLDAADSEHIHHFSAITFRQAASSILAMPALNRISTTRKKFVKAKNLFEQDPMKNLPVEAISGIEVRKFGNSQEGIISVNDVPLYVRPNGYTPLEKE